MNDRLKLEDRTKPTPFNGWNKINRAKKSFDDDTKIRRSGKDITLQEFINENNRDCTIYQVLETYRGDKKLTAQVVNKLSHKVVDEIAEIQDLPTAFEAMKLAEQSWRNLPLEIRKEFNHDIKNFQKNGLDWANKKIAEYKKTEYYQIEQMNKEQMNKQEKQKGAE